MDLANIVGEVASIYQHQRSINFNPKLSKIKVRRGHDGEHLGDQDSLLGGQGDHQVDYQDDHQDGDHHGAYCLAAVITRILARFDHSPLVERVVLGITLKGALLNYEPHLEVNYLLWRF